MSKTAAWGKSDKRDIFARIRDLMPEFSKSQRVIATAIITYPRSFAEKPIEELAVWLDISAPTITRFCRTVGCGGLRDLKLQVMGAAAVELRYSDHPEPPSTIREVRDHLSLRVQSAVVEGTRIADDLLEAAVERLTASKVIYVFGSGGVSNWLADEFQNRFFRLGKHVIPCRDGVMQAMFAATIDRETMVVCASLGGNNHAQLEAVRIAQEYGAFCLAICPEGTQMAVAADLTLPVETHDSGDILCPTPVRYAMLFTIDLLAYACAIRLRESVVEPLRRLKHQYVTTIEGDDLRPLAD